MVRFSKIVTVLIFSTNFVWNISHSKKEWVRYDHKCIFVFMYSTGYSCQRTWAFASEFGKMYKYNISWKPVQWEPSCSMRTDRHTDMTKLIFAFRNCAKAPIMGSYTIHVLWMNVIRKTKQEHDYWHTGRNQKLVQQASRFIELNVYHPEVLSKEIVWYYM
jgi:hypothetical protein